jgi:hypothetical protein
VSVPVSDLPQARTERNAFPVVIGLITVLTLTQFLWTRTLGLAPQPFNWIDDLLVLGIGGLALTRVPRPVPLSHAWAWALGAFALIALASALGNGVSAGRAILGMRGVVLYLPLYYAVVVASLDRDGVHAVLAVLLGLALLQLPVQMLQFLWGITRFGLDFAALGDIAVGTFGEGMANALGLFMVPFVALGVGLWLVGGGPKWLAAAAAFGVSLILSSGRAAALLAPVGIVAILGMTLGWRWLASPRQLVRLAAVAGVLVIAGEVYYRSTSGAGLAQRLSPAVLLREQLTYSPESSSRLAYYPVTWEVLATEAFSPWIGLGPGNYASGAGYLTNAPGLNLIRDVFGQWETDRETALNSQLLTSLGEFGILGLATFYLMLTLLLRRTLIVHARESDLRLRVLLGAIAVGQGVFIVGTLVEPVWEDQVLALPFWLTAALVTKLGQIQATPVVTVSAPPAPSPTVTPVPLVGDDQPELR